MIVERDRVEEIVSYMFEKDCVKLTKIPFLQKLNLALFSAGLSFVPNVAPTNKAENEACRLGQKPWFQDGGSYENSTKFDEFSRIY